MALSGGATARRLRELTRFGAAGAVSFLLDLAVLVALRTLTPMPLAVDSGAAFAVAALLNFTLTRRWVFATAAGGGNPSGDLTGTVRWWPPPCC